MHVTQQCLRGEGNEGAGSRAEGQGVQVKLAACMWFKEQCWMHVTQQCLQGGGNKGAGRAAGLRGPGRTRCHHIAGRAGLEQLLEACGRDSIPPAAGLHSELSSSLRCWRQEKKKARTGCTGFVFDTCRG
eukprot:scaffold33278_cov15-Tisochrysis_lutea.AAC.1